MQYWEKLLAAREPASAMEAGHSCWRRASSSWIRARRASRRRRRARRRMSRTTLRRPEGTAEWATTEPEEDEYLQYFDWDRFEAEQGDEAEAAEQGGEE